MPKMLSFFHYKKNTFLHCIPYYYINMTKLASLPESVPLSPAQNYLFDDSCILDMDYFLKTLISIKAKGVRPDLIGSIIAHYSSKWLPDLDLDDNSSAKNILKLSRNSPESATSSWMKKRFFVETVVGILPPEHDSVPCNFLLRLLKTGNMVGVDPMYRDELEDRIAWQLEQASLKEIMIPSFSCSGTCAALLDVELVRRLVSKFVSLDNESTIHKFVKVAKLVDSYLAEVGLDANLTLHDFVALAAALPGHVRASDDGLYRAIDTYLKAHPSVSKQERKNLCRLIDSRKLSPEASIHAAQNERLPVRAVIQVIFSEQTKLNRNIDWTGSFSGTRSPKPDRCPSRRQVTVQQVEIRRLREDVVTLQHQFNVMQVQIEKLKNNKMGFFRFVEYCLSLFKCVSAVEKIGDKESGEVGFRRAASVGMKNKPVRGITPPKRRSSMS